MYQEVRGYDIVYRGHTTCGTLPAIAKTMPTERVKIMTHDLEQTVKVLTERISQILDGAKELTDINMGSEAGRQIVAAAIARQMIYGRGQEDNSCPAILTPRNH